MEGDKEIIIATKVKTTANFLSDSMKKFFSLSQFISVK
jgi:hypothetical protein